MMPPFIAASVTFKFQRQPPGSAEPQLGECEPSTNPAVLAPHTFSRHFWPMATSIGLMRPPMKQAAF